MAHTAAHAPGGASQPALVTPQPMFFQVLKSCTLRRNPRATEAGLGDVRRALSFFSLTEAQRDIVNMRYQRQPSEADFEALLAQAHTTRTLTLAPKVKPLLARLLGSGTLQLRHPAVLTRQRMQAIHDLVLQAAAGLAGQEQAARSLAADLAVQLSADQPAAAARALVHGEQAWGTHQMIKAVSHALAAQLGFQVLEIDCSAYRTEGEGASWSGSKSYWAGSAPGEITSFIQRHPKAIVCLFNLDETLPVVMSVLRPALTDGSMTDYHGLDVDDGAPAPDWPHKQARQPTAVDCRQALFLCAISHGSHWLLHPQADTVLGASAAQQQANLIGEVRRATREYRGEQVALFDTVVLEQLRAHHHLLRPLRWPHLHAQGSAALHSALQDTRQRLGVRIDVAEHELPALAALALLHQGGHMGLAHATPEGMRRTLLEPLLAQVLQTAPGQACAAAPAALSLRLDDGQRQALDAMLAELGEDPARELHRRRQFASFRLRWPQPGEARAGHIQLQPVRCLSDYTGPSGLVSKIPVETLADVAGHEQAKAFLHDIVHHLRHPQLLRRHGEHVPRGVLLHGAAGTGKTMLARALAGQAGLPFISVTGSEMLEPGFMNRVYDIARRAEPCVLHIDEADVLGRRGQHSHAHDAAVNLLLSRIDGFEQHSGIFHVLTTNRPEALDAALTRPGRIDHRFEIGPLDIHGRSQCLRTLWPLLEPEARTDAARQRILRQCYRMTGAELARLRRDIVMRLGRQPERELAPLAWVQEAIARIQYGEENQGQAARGDAHRRRVAAHEAGHALLHHLFFPGIAIAQLSITPRNTAAGFLATNSEDAAPVDETPQTVRAYLAVLLAGRAAEIMEFGPEGPSAGASGDLARATEAAWNAVAHSGLDEEFGCLCLPRLGQGGAPLAALHEQAARRVRQWVEQASRTALRTLQAHQHRFSALRDALLEKETLDGHEVAAVLAASGNADPAQP